MDKTINNEKHSALLLNDLKIYIDKLKFDKIEHIIKQLYSKELYDKIARLIIRNFDKLNKKMHFIKVILDRCDLNYQNPQENNTTIPMVVIETRDSNVFEQLIQISQNDNSVNFKENNRFDPSIKNNDGNNLSHVLLKSDFKESNLILILKMLKESNKLVLDSSNNLGEYPLMIALNMGLSKLSEELIILGSDTSAINKLTGDSMLHYAVYGKNPSCVILVAENYNFKTLNNKNTDITNNFDIFNHKNFEGFTSGDIAKKLNLEQICTVISTFNNINNNNSNNNPNSMELISPLMLFIEGNYKTVIRLLDSHNNEFSSKSNDNYWNSLLCQIKLEASELKASPLSIYSKLQAYFDDKTKIPNHSSIYYYNRALFSYTKGLYTHFVVYARESLKISKSKLLSLNLLILLFEYYSYFKYFKQANECLKAIKDQFSINLSNKLDSNSPKKSLKYNHSSNANNNNNNNNNINNDNSSPNSNNSDDMESKSALNDNKSNNKNNIVHDEISFYLESIGLISSLEEDPSSLLFLYKSILSQSALNQSASKLNLTEFKKSIVSSNKTKRLLLNHFSFIYSCLKLKNDYLSNSISKFFLNSIKLFDSFENSVYFGLKTKIYYQNKLGIINLKLKKYSLSEYHFKVALTILQLIRLPSTILSWHRDFSSIKYNLALCYFYKKDYSNAYNVLFEIKNNIHRNLFYYYRLGLCCLEIFVKNKVDENEALCNYYGYNYGETDVKHNKNNNQETNVTNKVSSELQFNNNNNKDCLKRIALSCSYNNCYNNINSNYNYSNETEKENSYYNLTGYLKQATAFFRNEIIILKGYNEIEEVDNNEVCPKLNKILASSYLNLIFCLILGNKHREALYFINELDRHNIISEEFNSIILDNYKVNVYVNLNNMHLAVVIIKKMLSNISGSKIINY